MWTIYLRKSSFFKSLDTKGLKIYLFLLLKKFERFANVLSVQMDI